MKSGAGVRTYLTGLAASTDTGGGGAAGEADQQVLVKVTEANSISTAVGLRLSHEAEVLQQLAGPDGQPMLLDYGVDDGCIWLAQRYHPGRSLEERLGERALEVDCTLEVARSVLSQLAVAHVHGVVHRDVKPANIVVAGVPVREVLLVDFGLSRSARLHPALRDISVGTARYCSPEQAGLIEAPTDERSDLYSLGLTLFECLTGHPLLDGRSFGDVLRQHLAPRPALLDLPPTVPRSLAGVISRLVQIEPARRYQEAEAALADVEEIISARRTGTADPVVVIGRHDRRISLADPDFVGREADLFALEAELGAAGRGHGGVVTLEGESGSGKSRLLEELANRASASGMLVLRGQGADRTASEPFQIFERVTVGLAAAAERDPQLADRLQEQLSEHGAAIDLAAPTLARRIGSAGTRSGTALPEEHGQVRAAAALAATLEAAGGPDRPALVVLDDCQWAQGLTAQVVSQWIATTRTRWTLVVVAYRSDEVALSSPLRTVDTSRSLVLDRLSDGQVRDLVESMAGAVPESAVNTVIRLAEGNAFMAQAVLRGMMESGALERTERGWRLDERAAAEIQTSRRAALLLVKRLEALSAPTRQLLTATAVIGKSADVELVIQLSRLSTPEAVGAVSEARNRRILWLDEASGRLHFSHDMLRETVLEGAPADVRGDLHLQAAGHFLKSADDAPYQVAYHLDMAGRSADAFPYAVRAAEAARTRHALDDAETYYLIALRGAADDRTRFLVADGLGEVMALAGRYGDAEAYLTEAASLASDPAEEAAEMGKLGEVAFRRGDQATACDRLETAVRRLGRRIPRRRATLVLLVVWEILVQAAHTLSANRLTRQRRPDPKDQLALRFYSRLAYVYWFRHGRIRCLWVHLREMNLAERYDSPAARAQAYSEHAPVMTTIPWYRRGITYAARSLKLRRDLGDMWGEGQSLNFYGVALYSASRFSEAIDAFEESIPILALTGDRWEMHTALWNLALSHYRRGEWERAATIAADLYESSERIGDQTAAAIALSVRCRASAGDAPLDDQLELAESRHNDDQHAASEIRLARAVRLLHQNRPAEAAEVLEGAWTEVQRAGLRQEYVAAVLPWWATAMRSHVDALPAGDAWRAGMRDARRVARRAVRLSRYYRNNLPHALREQGLLAVRAGRLRRGCRLLERSARVAACQGAAWEEASSRRELARLGSALGWPETGADLERAEREAALIQPGTGNFPATPRTAPTLSLADRFSSLLEGGRRIAASTSTGAVFRSLEEAGAALLRSGTCVTVEIDIDGAPLVASDRPVSLGAIREAVDSRQVVTRQGAGEGEVTDSMVLAGIRSLLCAPVVCEDRVAACLYATHDDVAGLFGPDEEQLASFICAVAGATLEHVSESRAYFQTLVENAHDITVITDEHANVMYVSPAVRAVLGRKPEDLETTPQFNLIHPDDVPNLGRVWGEALEDAGRPHRVEARFRHADGSWRWMIIIISNRLSDPAVSGVVLNLRDTTERRRAEQQLLHQARHDPLTGLPNRRLLLERLERAMARSERRGTPLALLFMDLDRFKVINDSFGHATGDQVLIEVAGRLQGLTRRADTLARLGGDEFVVVAEDLSGADQAEELASRMEEALRDPVTIDPDFKVSVTTSIGIAMARPGDQPASLLRDADTALYRAKERGRGRHEMFGDHLRRQAVRRMRTERELQAAIEDGRLEMHYEPIVDLASGRAVATEATVLYRTESGDLVPQSEFCAVAEETGLSVAVGRWVLEAACRQLAAWRTSPDRHDLRVTINVSPSQLMAGGLAAEVEEALAANELPPSALSVEVAEVALTGPVPAGRDTLARLRQLGCAVGIDDFGTGQSSLAHLRQVPVDFLKIDRGFVDGLGRDADDETIVGAVVGLAEALSLTTVAVGVDSAGQEQILRRLGCRLGQGKLYGPPRPARELVLRGRDSNPQPSG